MVLWGDTLARLTVNVPACATVKLCRSTPPVASVPVKVSVVVGAVGLVVVVVLEPPHAVRARVTATAPQRRLGPAHGRASMRIRASCLAGGAPSALAARHPLF